MLGMWMWRRGRMRRGRMMQLVVIRWVVMRMILRVVLRLQCVARSGAVAVLGVVVVVVGGRRLVVIVGLPRCGATSVVADLALSPRG